MRSGMNGNPSVKRQVQWGLKTVIKLIVQVSVNPKLFTLLLLPKILLSY